MDWADVTWFEWCDKILVHASQKLRKTSRVVCRLHSYEALSNLPMQVELGFRGPTRSGGSPYGSHF